MLSRRDVLRATASAGSAGIVGGLAGCLGFGDGGPEAAVWRASTTAGVGRASPVVASDVVATLGHREDGDGGRVEAFDAEDGERRWTADVGRPTGLAADGARVYVGSKSDGGVGRVTAFGVADGERAWTAPVENLASALTATGDTVYAANGTLAAIDASDGAVRWEVEERAGVEFAVLAAPDDQLAATDDAAVFAGVDRAMALSSSDGTTAWDHALEDWESSTVGPYVDDDRVYVGSSEAQRVVALDRDRGAPVWRREYASAGAVVGFHAQNRSVVVAARTRPSADDGTGTVRVVDPDDGTVNRTVALDAPPERTASAHDRFVVATGDGTVRGYDVGWEDPELWRASPSGDDVRVVDRRPDRVRARRRRHPLGARTTLRPVRWTSWNVSASESLSCSPEAPMGGARRRTIETFGNWRIRRVGPM
ncbi:PQQ-binding-like beta-propeller repeat protein [Halorubellus sp. PRR65]|uniref:outer membrane protein assembly factor BamB family protein n=1 Tax=Halorubellus sp. PRR65 TaxID=3098148 RepID=UPI002B25C18C|nr:PQQ-binding-like beta-propeller repeat protein [Halorubellus sp. PRR65]